MKRVGYILIAVAAMAILGYFTYTKEHHSRYHLDTLRQERIVTTSIIGIPVWRSELKVTDRFSDTYRKLFGSDPDSTHWKVMRPDYIRTRGRVLHKNFGFGMQTRERMYLLTAVFERFEDGLPRETTIEIIRRIDDLLPATTKNDQEFDFEHIDKVRRDLGLETWQ